MSIGAGDVKQLREMTGAGMMDCKRALEKTDGDIDKATQMLREQGLAAVSRRSGKATGEGVVEAYVHAGARLGVIVEVNCETDFVAKTEQFKELAHNLALQIAAANPRWISRDQVPEQEIAVEREVLRAQAQKENKPEHIIDKMVEGRLDKFYGEACLLEQPFIRDDKVTIEQLVKQTIAVIGENIVVRRFARFMVGEQLPDQVT